MPDTPERPPPASGPADASALRGRDRRRQARADLPDGDPWTKRDEILRLDGMANLGLTVGAATTVAGVTLALTVHMALAAKICAVGFSVACGLCGIVGAMSLRHDPGIRPYGTVLEDKLFARFALKLLLGLLYTGVLVTCILAALAGSSAPDSHPRAQSGQRLAGHSHERRATPGN